MKNQTTYGIDSQNKSTFAKMLAVFMSLLLILFFAVPSFAYSEGEQDGQNVQNEQNDQNTATATVNEEVIDDASSASTTDNASVSATEASANTAGETAVATETAPQTYITVNYCEHYIHDEDGNPSDSGTRILGSRAFPATVGEHVNTWDYVADIPGFFFWDAWPANLVISENPGDNVLDLFYMRLSVSTYTVNYYAMTNADLTADTWAGALASHPQFHFLGHETFTGQLYDKLVTGSQVATPIDEAYTVGTYPDSIRLTLDPEDNVINVLYAPKATNLPDDMDATEDEETPDVPDVEQPDAPDEGDDEDTDIPDNGDGEEVEKPSPDNPDMPGVDVPDNGGDNESEEPPIGYPPVDDILTPGGDNDSNGEIEITDEMLDKAPTPQQAEAMKDAYKTGVEQGAALAQTGDEMAGHIMFLIGVILIAAGVIGIISWRHFRED